jgi:hypothetical protein
MVVPAAVATWPHRAERVEQGELAAVEGVCASLAEGDVVLAVDSRAANEWPQVVRGQCGHPALSTTRSLRQDPARLASSVATIDRAVSADGGRLVLLAAEGPKTLEALGATDVRQVSDAFVPEDARLLERRPDSLVPLSLEVWMATAP